MSLSCGVEGCTERSIWLARWLCTARCGSQAFFCDSHWRALEHARGSLLDRMNEVKR